MAQALTAAYGKGMIENKQSIAAVIVAAGRGERAGKADGPKQYRKIGGEAIIARTLRTFLQHPAISQVVVAVHRDDIEIFRAAAGELASMVLVAAGGATRQASTLAALRALSAHRPDAVLIHDGVRPFADGALIDRVIAGLDAEHGCIPSLPIVETLKQGIDGQIVGTIPRDGLYAAQTPQGFPFAPILAAHERATLKEISDFTDDASTAEWAGIPVRLVEGSANNVKLTYQRDIEMASQRLSQGFPDVRTGNGYDVHAFEPGDHVTLCSVDIPHPKRLSGHSDADVALHALTDALLATCGAGDIGTHFPPSDPQWRGAASRIFVEHAVRLVKERGGRIANADITLISEAPKVGPHRETMTRALSEMLGISADRVSVKATTNERLGFIGRAEGIAAIATATVVYPGTLPE